MQSLTLSWGRVGRAFFVVVAIELGLLLLTLPWTPLWDANLWLGVSAGGTGWRQLLLDPYVRGGVSGLGVLNLWAAASEITHFRM